MGCFRSLNSGFKFRAVQSKSCDDDEEDIESEELLTKRSHPERLSKAWIYLTIANAIILSSTIAIVIGARSSSWKAEKNALLRPVSWWSPVLDDIEIPSYETTINGTLFALPEISIAREEPSAANDAAWARYENVLTHVITRDQVIKLGKDPETVARFDNEYWGMGDDAYMAQLDVMHQIHCLNLLRKSAFADYPGYEPELDVKDKMWWIHLGHCTDILLQNIRCNANTEVLTLDWVEDRGNPWPDFSINRKCRDFDALLHWQHDNAVDVDKYDAMPVPKNAFVWPSPWKKQDYELGVKLGDHHFQEGEVLRDPHEHHAHQAP
ncbi:oxidase ustYa family protein [Aspergillus saccharolyticus JOP 1030-1]|uniref:Tat pathway signal sequence n=1 Tax=Aspergillus saccharolyticus JOP 1030-1 TaxID=1450539 RepID=A0A318Z5R3_9EURO|nr:hypothetical protein BP01DRAFT_303184 [Aspergillus saccharolyticus JOP 1030-1]PYH42456.1 hypothetical protein BP01DRAFT_303184 [Aspergillus saccharolyticus JOP 1030-1]